MSNLPHYCLVGQGQRHTLLLHGWGCNIETMMPIAQSLQETTAILLDFPGHGQTPPPSAVWGVEDFGKHIVELLSALAIDKVDIIAHSFGGRVALWLASCYPDRVGRLVLTGGAGIRPRRKFTTRVKIAMYKLQKNLLGKGIGLKICNLVGVDMQKRLQKAGSSDYRAITDPLLRQTFVRIVGEDLSPLLTTVKAQTLLVWGEKDDATPLWMGQMMEKRIPDAGLVVFSGRGHYAFLEEASRFCQVVNYFFTQGR